MVHATFASAQSPEDASAAIGGWGGGTEVHPAGAAPPKPRLRAPPSSSPAKAPADPIRHRAGGRRSTAASADHGSAAAANAVIGYQAAGDRDRTALQFSLVGPTDLQARSLSNPPRVIVDLPETTFRLPPGTGQSGHGLVTAFRYGLIEAGKSRIVIDTAGPAKVARAEVVLADAGSAFTLELELVPTSERELAAIEIAEAALTFRPVFPDDGPGAPRAGLPARPVVVVDAGHGGIDSGASGSRVAEKDLTLAVARHIEKALASTARYEVIMTRDRDVFVSLDERVAISRRHHADLFVSIHADSLPNREAAGRVVRGATVYTLAEQASDDLTRRVADKENAVDLLAGLPVSMSADDQVRDILLDLMRRESLGFAADFRQLLIGEMGNRILLSHNPKRSGPFKVLRQPASPSVLVELGYVSNLDDERVMMQPDWQAKLAAAVARSVDAHFRRRTVARQ